MPKGAPAIIEHVSDDETLYLAKLLTKQHLEEESVAMKHCIGTNDYYSSRMLRGDLEIFSIRDTKTHKPLLTIQYDKKSRKIVDMRGHGDASMDNNPKKVPMPSYPVLREFLEYIQVGVAYDTQGIEFIRGLLGAKSGSKSISLQTPKSTMDEKQLRSIVRSVLTAEDGDMAQYILYHYPIRIPERSKLQALVRESLGPSNAYSALLRNAPLLPDKERAQHIATLLKEENKKWAYKAVVNIPHLFPDEREKLLSPLLEANDPVLALRILRNVSLLDERSRSRCVSILIAGNRPALIYECYGAKNISLTDNEQEKLLEVLETRSTGQDWQAYHTRLYCDEIRPTPQSVKDGLFRIICKEKNQLHNVVNDRNERGRFEGVFSDVEVAEAAQILLKEKEPPYHDILWYVSSEQQSKIVQKLCDGYYEARFPSGKTDAHKRVLQVLARLCDATKADDKYKARYLDKDLAERLFSIFKDNYSYSHGSMSDPYLAATVRRIYDRLER